MKTPHIKSIGRSALRRGFLLIPLAIALASFTVAPAARATCQEGCLTNQNTVLGDDALLNNTGVNNTANGSEALAGNTTGYDNTAIGSEALEFNTVGYDNTATGFAALFSNTAGTLNTATGNFALHNNTTGVQNTANGNGALTSNTVGNYNTATGVGALELNTTGEYNTGTGFAALFTNTTGTLNTATGTYALYNNTIGVNNTASGWVALNHNITGNNNTAMGFEALLNNRKGSNNIALGSSAGSALTTGDNNIDIGNPGIAGESGKIRIGTQETQTKTFIAGIRGTPIAGGMPVGVTANGQLGVASSSQRFKEAIKPMDKASEAIRGLQPVTFRYKHELDPEGIPQFGLVAEDVEKVNPDLVARDEQGKPCAVRYEAVNAMLLNEFLKEHRTVQEQKESIAQLKQNFAEQQKQIEALTAGLQKASDQLEMSKAAPQMVLNNQ